MRGQRWGAYTSFEGVLQEIDTSGEDCRLGLWDDPDFGDDERPDRVVSVSKERMREAADLLGHKVRVKGRFFWGGRRARLIALPSAAIEDLGVP